MGHLAKTVKQSQIMGAFEVFGPVKSVDVSCMDIIVFSSHFWRPSFRRDVHVSLVLPLHRTTCGIVILSTAVGSGTWLCLHCDGKQG